jgi:diguanylate cyclase
MNAISINRRLGDALLSDDEISELIHDPAYAGHPLQQALAQVFGQMQEQLYQLDRVTRISDQYQDAARRNNDNLRDRLQKNLRHIEKVARISDRYSNMLQSLNGKLEYESNHDSLTQLPNRRYANRLLNSAFNAKLTAPLFIGIFDVDHFKHVNDSLGHEVGDVVLQRIASAFRAVLGTTEQQTAFDDIWAARWGGEEFLLCVRAERVQVEDLIERIRQAINAATGDAVANGITASVGVTAVLAKDSVREALMRADAQLYAAKAAGRNRVHWS